jgi:ABC-type multidrug transport system ATPase subunit
MSPPEQDSAAPGRTGGIEQPLTTPVLDVRGVAYAYPDGNQALFGVTLQIQPGERVALLGPNGAGKTTLVLHLNGILHAGAGSVAVSGLTVDKTTLAEIRRRDEPSSNLDPRSRREFADLLRGLDVTVLMVTHDLPYALELCERAVVLSDGVIVADGPTFDVLTDEESMHAHRLELPFGFDPRATRAND